MPAQVQRKLVLDDKPTLVLSTVEMARQLLPGHDEDDILSLIEEGFLLYAWNIALVRTSRCDVRDRQVRREIRIWPDCITWYSRTYGKGQYQTTDADIQSTILRPAGDKPYLTSTQLRLLLNCGSTHIINLIESKQLAIVPGTSWGTGPNGAALITLKSITDFLKTRRLT